MGTSTGNELLSSQKSDSGLHIALHPLPILEVSDHITRAHQRRLQGAIVGALLGHQDRRQITIEHSFPCKAVQDAEEKKYTLDSDWFAQRLEQFRQVHPTLDLVGWYALVPKTGPTPDHLPIHHQILRDHNEAALLLGFHLDEVLDPAPGEPLPLTLYESSLEAEDRSRHAGGDMPKSEGEDREMKDVGSAPKMVLRFRDVPFTTETEDAEMIAIQFIREGGANAQREGPPPPRDRAEGSAGKAGKGKQRAAQPDDDDDDDEGKTGGGAQAGTREGPPLTRDESELISALQAKSNAVRMLQNRIGLVIRYLETLPPDALAADGAAAAAPPASADPQQIALSHGVLRQIRALVTNIELLRPRQQEALEDEMREASNDVAVVSLMKDVLASLGEVRELGKKFAVVDAAKTQRSRNSHFDVALAQGHPPLGSAGDLHHHLA